VVDEGVIHVALASNECYLPGLEVTMATMAVRAVPGVRLCFHVLDGGIEDSRFEEFAGRVRRLRQDCAIMRHRLDDERGFRDVFGKRMAYKRLLLPEILHDLEFALYCDVDFLWLEDVSGLWEQRDSRLLLQATHDKAPETMEGERRWFTAHGIPFDGEQYFSTGLMLMNLRKFREDNVAPKVFSFLEGHPDVNLADQSALNAVVPKKEVGFLASRWQVFSRDVCFTRDSDGPVAVHYAGEIPWLRRANVDMLTDMVLFWHRVNATLRGISLWRALRLHFGACEIIVRRMFFLFATSCLTVWLFRLALVISRRGCYINRFGMWWRRLETPEPRKLFLHESEDCIVGA